MKRPTGRNQWDRRHLSAYRPSVGTERMLPPSNRGDAVAARGASATQLLIVLVSLVAVVVGGIAGMALMGDHAARLHSAAVRGSGRRPGKPRWVRTPRRAGTRHCRAALVGDMALLLVRKGRTYSHRKGPPVRRADA